jgi:hypothetical protein
MASALLVALDAPAEERKALVDGARLPQFVVTRDGALGG